MRRCVRYIFSLFFILIHIYPISSTPIKNLTCQLNPTHIFSVDLFPHKQKIRISKVKRHCQTSGRKSSNLENPLFISVLNSPISPSLTSILRTPHGSWQETCPPAALQPSCNLHPPISANHVPKLRGYMIHIQPFSVSYQ